MKFVIEYNIIIVVDKKWERMRINDLPISSSTADRCPVVTSTFNPFNVNSADSPKDHSGETASYTAPISIREVSAIIH